MTIPLTQNKQGADPAQTEVFLTEEIKHEKISFYEENFLGTPAPSSHNIPNPTWVKKAKTIAS